MLLFSVIGAVHISSWQMLCFSLVSAFFLTRSDVFLTNNCCVFHCYALNFSPIGVLFLTKKRCISHKKSCVLVDNWCLSKKIFLLFLVTNRCFFQNYVFVFLYTLCTFFLHIKERFWRSCEIHDPTVKKYYSILYTFLDTVMYRM
jgi:hypothetical protein